MAKSSNDSSAKGKHHFYDRMLKSHLHSFAPELAAWLVNAEPIAVEELDPDLAAVEERVGDKLLILRFHDRRDLAVHCELELEGRITVPVRMARFMLLAAECKNLQERDIGFASFVVYLDKKTYRPDPGCYRLEGEHGTNLLATYSVVKLWEIDPREILDRANPGLMPFAPLLRGDPRALFVESVERIRTAEPKHISALKKKDLLGVLVALASRVIQDKDWIVSRILEDKDMSKDWLFEDYFEPGWDQGMTVGLKQGREEGKVEGKVEGKTEGRADEARHFIRHVLQRRFGQIPASVEVALTKESAISALEHLHDVALDAESIEAFEATIRSS